MLTQLKVQNAEHRDRPYKLADGSGLYLFVSPTAKLWRLKYRFAGKEKVLSIRMYPEVSLATWPAPGSEDTELGVLMGPEVRHG